MDKADNAYRTITEVSELLQVQPSVLRFWETQFHQLKPLKRMGNRRYYSTEDITLVTRIRDLLYKEGFTIKGVQKKLKEKEDVPESQTEAPISAAPVAEFISELTAIRDSLKPFLD